MKEIIIKKNDKEITLLDKNTILGLFDNDSDYIHPESVLFDGDSPSILGLTVPDVEDETLLFGDEFVIPKISCDRGGHITDLDIITFTLPSLPGSITPVAHATNSTTYGGGTVSNYGHVKVSDNYTSSAGTAAQSVAASSKAVADLKAYVDTQIGDINNYITS